jgi:hypothetical protein
MVDRLKNKSKMKNDMVQEILKPSLHLVVQLYKARSGDLLN